MQRVFMFLDDDAFRADKVRCPRRYYPLIGAHKVLEIMEQCEVVKFATVEGAQDYIERNGCPFFISFDNDLQRDLEGVDLAKWLIERDLDIPGTIPEDFQFFVHSQNVAAQRIYGLLNQYLELRGSTK